MLGSNVDNYICTLESALWRLQLFIEMVYLRAQ